MIGYNRIRGRIGANVLSESLGGKLEADWRRGMIHRQDRTEVKTEQKEVGQHRERDGRGARIRTE